MHKRVYSFQVDDEIIKRQRRENDNFFIENEPVQNNQNKICAIYFSSNDIYYPNTEAAFGYSIIEVNRYEWLNCKITSAQKHIFLRDVNKQWYLSGINDVISSPERLLTFLKKETEGYDIVTIGSSAGGYAAILYGILLDAKYVLAFNAQIEIKSLLETNEEKNPLVFRLKNTPVSELYDLAPIIKGCRDTKIYYFVSMNSEWDRKQIKHVVCQKLEMCLNIIRFKSSHHGIPFPKVVLPRLFEMDNSELKRFSGHTYSPVFFSMKIVGVFSTICGILDQYIKFIKKIIKRFKN